MNRLACPWCRFSVTVGYLWEAHPAIVGIVGDVDISISRRGRNVSLKVLRPDGRLVLQQLHRCPTLAQSETG